MGETMGKPNIIFILIDDRGWRGTACCGSNFYETPVIDSISKNRMMFIDAYASAPVCSPTRTSIMGGKYPALMGLRTGWEAKITHSVCINQGLLNNLKKA
jgi:arylsulfatase A-like enzyme